MNNKILFLDLETTGTDFAEHSIVEFGGVFYNGRELTKTLKHYMQSPKESNISMKAMSVNHTDIRTYLSNYPRKEEKQFAISLADEIITLNRKYGKLKIGGHNVAFDIVFIKTLFNKFNIKGWDEIFDFNPVDTSVIGHFLRSIKVLDMQSFNLHKLAEVLKIEIEEQHLHKAWYDAEITAKCYFALQDLIRGK